MLTGRLNMLVNVCRKQLMDIFAQFKPMEPKEPVRNKSLPKGNVADLRSDRPHKKQISRLLWHKSH